MGELRLGVWESHPESAEIKINIIIRALKRQETIKFLIVHILKIMIL